MSITLALLASGRGSNIEAIIHSIEEKRIDAKIGVVISNKKDAPVLQIAQKKNINALFVDPNIYKTKQEYDAQIVRVLKECKVDLVCLAGYMKILTPAFISEYKGKIMNIHPSLLPAFPGLSVQKKALLYGVKYSGCTVHFVDEGVDTGPIILQEIVPVYSDDTVETLSERILEKEHKIYPEAISLFAKGRLKQSGRRITIVE